MQIYFYKKALKKYGRDSEASIGDAKIDYGISKLGQKQTEFSRDEIKREIETRKKWKDYLCKKTEISYREYKDKRIKDK